MSIIIGLTGPTGAGKSSVSKAASASGFQIINCDSVARKTVEKGTEGLHALTIAFGEEILLPDGRLDRKKLAKIAFSDLKSTELLNKTILPFIAESVRLLAENKNSLLDAPTLFESGINTICFKTIAVLADSQIRQKRIIERDNLTISEARLRMNAGKQDDFYKDNADYVIYNNGNENDFTNRFLQIINNIIGGSLNGSNKNSIR